MKITTLSQQNAELISHWHYSDEYSFYNTDADQEDFDELLSPQKRGNRFYQVLSSNNTLIGYFCIKYTKQDEIERLNENFFIQKAQQTHSYVFLDNKTIIGIGAIGPYWDSQTEFSLFDIFVDPNYQGLGIGRFIINTLENDTYFTIATRVEIPASITALGFYKKMGYYPKNKQTEPDSEGLFRLEKYPNN